MHDLYGNTDVLLVLDLHAYCYQKKGYRLLVLLRRNTIRPAISVRNYRLLATDDRELFLDVFHILCYLNQSFYHV